MTAWPGEQLVRAAQDGDAEAVRALVSGSYPHVLRFAKTLCATPQDAEDAAQEALIILYSRIGMLRATAALASWMFRIVRNECLRRARFWARGGARSGGTGAEAVCGPAEDDVLARLEAEAVVAAIVALPEDLRRVLIMRDVQGHSGRAVADEMGLSLAAMKSRLHRARAQVRASLLADGSEEAGRG
ncbi:RNA polymerase sigma factor [Catenulispora sp. GAS73]|uniref:RNA polymerase sigma factor n=1 Tax=Catenulispora sp. GAS73 TaxID=3156269 RepID=UPI00351217DE